MRARPLIVASVTTLICSAFLLGDGIYASQSYAKDKIIQTPAKPGKVVKEAEQETLPFAGETQTEAQSDNVEAPNGPLSSEKISSENDLTGTGSLGEGRVNGNVTEPLGELAPLTAERELDLRSRYESFETSRTRGDGARPFDKERL